MVEMSVIIQGLATSNEGDAYVYRIYNRWHIRQRKPCQLPEKLLQL